MAFQPTRPPMGGEHLLLVVIKQTENPKVLICYRNQCDM